MPRRSQQVEGVYLLNISLEDTANVLAGLGCGLVAVWGGHLTALLCSSAMPKGNHAQRANLTSG